MIFSRLAFFSALMMIAAGCAGGMSATECAGADWSALGLEDGLAGAGLEALEDRQDSCDDDAPINLAAYEAARLEGLKTYCTPEGGFGAGKAGGVYEQVCAGEDEMQFLASFALGQKLYTLTQAKEKAVRDYETAIADLDQHKYLLRVSEKRYMKPAINAEDREHERQDAEFRRREIARVEGRIPAMLDEIEKTRVALAAYEAELAAMGLTSK